MCAAPDAVYALDLPDPDVNITYRTSGAMRPSCTSLQMRSELLENAAGRLEASNANCSHGAVHSIMLTPMHLRVIDDIH